MKSPKVILNITLAIAIVAAVVFLKIFLGVIALAALTAIIFMPLHHRIHRSKGPLRRFATALTLLAALLTMVIPTMIIVAASLSQILQLLSDLRGANFLSNDSINHFVNGSIIATNHVIGQVPFADSFLVTKEGLAQSLHSLSNMAVSYILNFFTHASGNIVVFFTNAIIYLFLLATIFSRSDRIVYWLYRLSPFRFDITKEYLHRAKAMAMSMVTGTVAIGLVNGAAGAASLWIIGFPYPLFWLIFLTTLSLLPLGAGMVLYPVGVILLMTGQIWQGLVVLLIQLLIINNSDNVLRPLLASKEGGVPAVLVLMSALAGVGIFGLIGVVYGPIIMILITTTFEMYDRYAETGIPLKGSAKS
jgi:predicted PurR-regulated permease PerM